MNWTNWIFSRNSTDQNSIHETAVTSYRTDKSVRNDYILRRHLVYRARWEIYSDKLRYMMNKTITLRWHIPLRY